MRFRGKSIRRKIVALLLVPLVSLTAIWAFATVITGREAMQLLDAADIVDEVGYPVEDAVHAIQKERRQALIFLADPSRTDALTVLRARQQDTDQVIEKLRANAGDGDTRDKMSTESKAQLGAILKTADGLENVRRSIEGRTYTSERTLATYNKLVDLCYILRSSLHSVPNAELDKQARALVAMVRAREALSREDAIYSAALTAGTVTPAQLRSMSDLIAERSLLYATNVPVLPASEQKIFQRYRLKSAAPEALRIAEDRIQRAGPSGALKAMSRQSWERTAKAVLDDYDRLNSEAMDRYQDRVEPEAENVLLQAGIAGILGFLALAASIFVSFRIGRTLIRDLSQLRKDAQEVATVRLPSVMRRLAAGEQVDVETEAPRLKYGADEMGQVGQALNTVQRAAVEAAVKQAELRHGVSEVFVNLARRSQVLLHRQLTLLDEMERRTEDTDELADLFRLDHMTTRMRRHAEGLVILSGAAPSRQWRKPIPLMDVVRAAVAEVEDYERIEVRRLPRLAVAGPAVADLTHLIAELLENATVFSPPHTAVQVLGERVANGFTLEIHDRGLGMTPDALLEANLRLAETPDFELSDTDRLGLFVVSRLAQRQGVRVSLQPSPYGGTTAVLLIPAKLLTDDGEPDQDGPGVGHAEPRAALGSGGLGTIGEIPAVFPDHAARNSSLLDGRAEPTERTATPSWSQDGVAPLPQGGFPARAQDGFDEDDEEAGSLFRGRGLPSVPSAPASHMRPVPDPWAASPAQSAPPVQPTPPVHPVPPVAEQHQHAADRPLPIRTSGPAPLPRRVPPVLVSDNGRPVPGARRGPAPSRIEEPRVEEPRGWDANAEGPRGWDPHAGQPAPPLAGPVPYQDRESRQGLPQPSAPTWNPEPAVPSAPQEPAMPSQGATPDTPPGLPRRIRQASLAPQLKNDPVPRDEAERYPAETDDPERDAEQARATMASLQRGWQRGRRHTDADFGNQA
ncbi:nitrate- and nitrite sensing domain-containing protein [Streptomyces sp. XD-27]|uniref:sensor histidine kinase n=1 Tax=Streptomyces sp. XD-27 TaxID=3062779 RepID=UPI0026F4512D|nr:nitrate- and nitrite sensing domain-containing protein [Streptomyces sp. XD-27]WKX73697.1 nitrate- and nitrite sensing domain-containing protein [Streptomyces sp. XD-27]